MRRPSACLFFILALLVSWNLSAHAQIGAPAFNTFDMESGITHVTVSDVAEDKYGFLWLASQSGIDKFDGYTFRNFGMWGKDESSGLQTLSVLQLEASLDGQFIWVGTFSGLSRLNVDTEKFIHYALPVSSSFDKQIINRLKTTHDGMLWIISERNLYRYHEKTDSIELVSYLPDTTSTLTDVELIGNTLYVTSTSGLYKLDPFKGSLELVAYKGVNFTRLVAAERSRFWLGTSTYGICLFNPNAEPEVITKQCTSEAQGLSDNSVTDILLQRNGDVWVATERGLNLLTAHSPYTVLRFPISDKDSGDERVSSLYQTNSGLVVVGTKDDGFAISNPELSNFYTTEVGNGRIVGSMTEYKGNKVWLTNEKGLWIYDTVNKAFQGPFTSDSARTTDDSASDKLTSVYYDKHSDTLWVSTRSGLAKLNNETKQLEVVALQGKSGYSVNMDAQGDIWFGGYSDGVFVYRPSEGRVIKQWPLSLTTRILFENNESAWLSTVTGLHFANKLTGELTSISDYTDKMTDSTVVTWISRSKRGGYWVGTQADGLFFVTKNNDDLSSINVNQIKPESRLSKVSIGAIVEDDEYGLWISTIVGISYLAPDLDTLYYYGAENGALSTGYYIGSVATTENNTILFGGAEGLTQFNPSDVTNVKWSPDVHLTKVETVNRDQNNGTSVQQRLNLGEKIELTHNNIALSIEFAATDYMNANELRYAYKLVDFENSWRFTDYKARVATYTNLEPGHYRFTVKAINQENVWSSDEAQLEIIVIPPWWDKPVWRGVLLLSILLFITSVVWLRISALKARSAELSLKVEEKTQDLEAMVEKLTLLSSQDSLTGLKNRRYFTERAKAQWHEFKRHNRAFSLLIVDIDFFKKINDAYGHHVGDAVLVKIANTLENNLRESDVIARWGGEEFLILLPSLNIQEAYWVAEKLRKSVAEQVVEAPPHSVSVTITCGVADTKDYDSVDACIHAVDKKLYVGKESGRNAVVK
ncbi:ligand-binding sensor domain-containing diguanylate cyclase [Alteromonas macleodii]|uniref:diguanylate cyclase n=1 Tax=Alteromonas macleodii TaxID=28108 RepID=A0A6T9Y2T2_ALTMA|nr:ligand-binding sensor domain-containing diguanylate cyclase [Alteromonas macleodii]CAB9493709.1 Diguanylate cyclase [Alteromonas macleodii]